eukprot:IDg7812t1
MKGISKKKNDKPPKKNSVGPFGIHGLPVHVHRTYEFDPSSEEHRNAMKKAIAKFRKQEQAENPSNIADFKKHGMPIDGGSNSKTIPIVCKKSDEIKKLNVAPKVEE